MTNDMNHKYDFQSNTGRQMTHILTYLVLLKDNTTSGEHKE